jgi:hypothetical protein
MHNGKKAMIKLLARRGLAWIKEIPNHIRSRCFRQPAAAPDRRRSFVDSGFTSLAWFHRESYAKSEFAGLPGGQAGRQSPWPHCR